MSDPILYGIANCDKVRAARKWLDGHGIAYRFHDLRKDGVDEALLQRWLRQVDLKTLTNARSASWRSLSPERKQALQSGDAALLRQVPTLIRRPILQLADERLLIGFDPDLWQETLK